MVISKLVRGAGVLLGLGLPLRLLGGQLIFLIVLDDISCSLAMRRTSSGRPGT